MQLTHAQKQTFYQQGFLKVAGVIPPVMIEAAVRAINASLGQGIDPAQVPIYQSRSFCPELQREAVITDLFTKTPALPLAESLIGQGKIQPVGGGQIALRFPTLQDPPNPPRPHLDGMHSPNNGVPAGTIRNFTMLLGVALSDVTTPFAGNLAVWPGTHHLYERYFQEHGPAALLNGMPPIAIGEPVQLLAQAGDIILAHYQLAHGVTANTAPHTRYAIYFRLHHVDHDQIGMAAMTDIWREWAGVAGVGAA